MKAIFSLIFIIVVISGCSSGSSTNSEPAESGRSFKMGFTPWLYAASVDAQQTTYNRLNAQGDMIKHHFMGGVPWQEAFDKTPYRENLQGEIAGRLARTGSSVDVFLAIDSLNSARDGLTLYWGDTQNMPLSGEWANRSWSSPEVITAYINFASDLIDRFQPTHFEYATEISELILNKPEVFADYLVFSETIYTALSQSYPDLKLITSVAMKSPASNEMQMIKGSMVDIMPFTDVLGISIYPYAFFAHADKGDPENLPANWLTQASQIANGKPMAISESGWIAEDLDIKAKTYTVSETSDTTKQAAYASLLLESANDLDMEFVIWWAVTDYDVLWTDTLGQNLLAKIWKDIGLYDESQVARPALTVWDSWLNKPLR